MNKIELAEKVLKYLSENNLFGKDKNFLLNKASSHLGEKKENIQRAVAFLIAENMIAIKNEKIEKFEDKKEKLVNKNILPEQTKDMIPCDIREDQNGNIVAYPLDETNPINLQQDNMAEKCKDKICLVRVTSNKKGARFGAIKQTIGNNNDFEALCVGILLSNHIRMGYGQDCLNQAKEIIEQDISKEIESREDWRKLPFVAVDNFDCKDRDDAFYVKKTEDGYRLYVAITDITHYVKEGTPLWKEAYLRSTSHYMPTFSVPMFPANVTNTIFSLDEGRDRLVLGAIIDFDKNGKRKSFEFSKAVVKIHHAMSYENFEDIKNGKKEVQKFKNEDELVLTAYELAQKIHSNMLKNNKINAEANEPMYVLDENKQIVDIKNADKSFSHKVIEMFMIEANRSTGDFFLKNKIDGIYRVHERILPEKFVELKQILEDYGINYSLENTSVNLANLINQTSGFPYSDFLQGKILAKFCRAKYSAQENIHFGLGFGIEEPYTHFTSPVRRFSDVIAHKLIKDKLLNKKISLSSYQIENTCMHINDQQEKAEKLERKIDNLAICDFAQKNIGKTIDGTICQFGRDFVLVKDKKSPMVLCVDFDKFKSNAPFKIVNKCLKISNGTKTMSIGQDIKCKISDVDMEEKHIYAEPELEKEIALENESQF